MLSFLEANQLVKGGLFLTLYYFLWFQSKDHENDAKVLEKRQILLYTLLACIPGLIAVRALAALLPFRTRPLYNPDLHLRAAAGMIPQNFASWSSFPSDHSFLFFALATGIFLVNRKLGYFLYLYATLIIALPRLFLGIHYPSDLLVGALMGIGLAWTASWPGLRSLVTVPAFRLLDFSPGLFHGCLFFIAEQTAGLYNPLRSVALGLWKLTHLLLTQVRH